MHPLYNLLFLPSITLFVTASIIPDLSPASISHPLASSLPLLSPNNVTTTTTTTTSDPSFLSTVISTVLKTIAQYPTATFRLVRISSPTGPTSSFPAALTDISIIFSVPDDAYKSIYVNMTPTWSVWEPPYLSREEVPSEMGYMRLDVKMELAEAWTLVWDQGVREAYTAALLYWPVSPPKPTEQQPFYRFEVSGLSVEGDVYVGAWTRAVTRTLGVARLGNSSTVVGTLDVV
ncbi:MAG: hypothetical protein ALECFALPRED_006864 [Alectoria fallacina]|uniref:Uncharacterized protein n=1 Tax=Alectoria fallacina TaxID=1903189 RepID=A0A8H3GB63_9LECA|nr:MAG: hypothetical protein ALECFALPRED_006864 [Alectoria fallacina]